MGAELPQLDSTLKQQAVLESAQLLTVEASVDNQHATVEAATPTTDQAHELIKDMGGLEAHKNKYGGDVSKCPFLNSLGEAGLKMFEALSAEPPTVENKKTIAEIMAEKRQQKQHILAESSAKIPDEKPEQVSTQSLNEQKTLEVQTIQTATENFMQHVHEQEVSQDLRQKNEDVHTDLHQQISHVDAKVSVLQIDVDLKSSTAATETAVQYKAEQVDEATVEITQHNYVQTIEPKTEIAIKQTGSIVNETGIADVVSKPLATLKTVELQIPELIKNDESIAAEPSNLEVQSLQVQDAFTEAVHPDKGYMSATSTPSEVLHAAFTDLIQPELLQDVMSKSEHITKSVVELLKCKDIVNIPKVIEAVQQHFEHLLQDIGLNVDERVLKATVTELVQQLYEQFQIKSELSSAELSIAFGTHEFKTMTLSTMTHFTNIVAQHVARFIVASRYILKQLSLYSVQVPTSVS